MKIEIRRRRIVLCALAGLLLIGCGSKASSSTTTTTAAGYGTPADASKASRTIEVHIVASPLHYNPSSMTVKPGETVLVKVVNDTTGIHEFVLGDQKVQDDYQKTMTAMGNAPMAMPSTANILNLAGGKSSQLAWTFPSVAGATVIYGSHEPGDYSGGLRGTITVSA